MTVRSYVNTTRYCSLEAKKSYHFTSFFARIKFQNNGKAKGGEMNAGAAM
jgi:hypothetical protein